MSRQSDRSGTKLTIYSRVDGRVGNHGESRIMKKRENETVQKHGFFSFRKSQKNAKFQIDISKFELTPNKTAIFKMTPNNTQNRKNGKP